MNDDEIHAMIDAYKVAGHVPVSQELLMDDPEYARTHPWLEVDPNPFPRFRLFRGWRL